MIEFEMPSNFELQSLKVEMDHFLAGGLEVEASSSHPVIALTFLGRGSPQPLSNRMQILLSVPAAVLLRRELGKAIKGYLNSAEPEQNPPTG